jgi:prefoldin subunit 5
MNEDGGTDRYRISIFKKENKWFEEFFDVYGQSESIREINYNEVNNQFQEALISNSTLNKTTGKQPTQTKGNTTSIESVKSEIDAKKGDFVTIETLSQLAGQAVDEEGYMIVDYGSGYLSKELSEKVFESYKDAENALNEFEKSKPKKEYTSQAETNLKIAALKEVARKYPRSLITSKVVPINPNLVDNSEIQYSKVGSKQDIEGFKEFVNKPTTEDINEISLYLSRQIHDKFGVKIGPLLPNMLDLLNNQPVINQEDVDNKKLEC